MYFFYSYPSRIYSSLSRLLIKKPYKAVVAWKLYTSLLLNRHTVWGYFFLLWKMQVLRSKMSVRKYQIIIFDSKSKYVNLLNFLLSFVKTLNLETKIRKQYKSEEFRSLLLSKCDKIITEGICDIHIQIQTAKARRKFLEELKKNIALKNPFWHFSIYCTAY